MANKDNKGLKYDNFITDLTTNINKYKLNGGSYKDYLEELLRIIYNDPNLNNKQLTYKDALLQAIILGPQETDDEREYKLSIFKVFRDNIIINKNMVNLLKKKIPDKYGQDFTYESRDDIQTTEQSLLLILQEEEENGHNYGGRNNPKPKHDDMTMKDIKELCKANKIKLSRVVEGKRVAYKKNELLTKLKRKKLV